MKRLDVLALALVLSLSCSSPAQQNPAATFARSSMTLLPEGYAPPGDCFAARRTDLAHSVVWEFVCRVGNLDATNFSDEIRATAGAQGWLECGRAWLFVKEATAMAIQIGGRQNEALLSGAQPVIQLAMWIEQWHRTGECG